MLFHRQLFLAKKEKIVFIGDMKRRIFLLLVGLFANFGWTQELWTLEKDGISFVPQENKAHRDNIEMAGLGTSFVVAYGVNQNGTLHLTMRAFFPKFRMNPLSMETTFFRDIDLINPLYLFVTGGLGNVRQIPEKVIGKVKKISLDGILTIEEEFKKSSHIKITRKIYPSPTHPAIFQLIEFENLGEKPANLEIPEINVCYAPNRSLCEYGQYKLRLKSHNSGGLILQPKQKHTFALEIQAAIDNKFITLNPPQELTMRKEFVENTQNSLVLNSPSEKLNTMFSFAKIRTTESVFDTHGGLIHSPAGERYYAGFWANDQAEYANPFFPFLGEKNSNAAAQNMFGHWSRFLRNDFKMLPSAITGEGRVTWNGVGDRGDAAMVAYGATRYALACGDKKVAKKLEPLIDWCLEYCKRNLNASGVVKSDTDELENRFPAGKANLCTSSLYYDALLSASYLKTELGDSATSQTYFAQAQELHKNMRKYFEGKVEGFDTYKYYEDNNILRSWICIPLCMGIFDKKDGTIAALTSDKLLTKEGMRVQTGVRNFWDRTYLYALRGIFAAGEPNMAWQTLEAYINERLLGSRVPYAIEAFPEGGKAHLAAESALFCRIVTEGIFGIRPTGFKSFELTPSIPSGWQEIELKNIKAFGKDFNIKLNAKNGEILVSITSNTIKHIIQKRIKRGETVKINF